MGIRGSTGNRDQTCPEAEALELVDQQSKSLDRLIRDVRVTAGHGVQGFLR